MTTRRFLLGLLLGLLVGTLPASARKASYDIIIAIDGSDAQAAVEHELRLKLEKDRALRGLSSEELPIDTYSYAVTGHAAALQRLGIPKWQAPFLGVGQLGEQGEPTRLLQGGGPVQDRDKAVADVLTFAATKLGLPANASPTPAGESAVVRAAREWLALIDAGQYVESCHQAAAYFQARVMPNAWNNTMKLSRAPLGNVSSRTLTTETPEGDHVVLMFNTAFAGGRSGTERVVLRQEDGRWRVSGYFIHRH